MKICENLACERYKDNRNLVERVEIGRIFSTYHFFLTDDVISVNKLMCQKVLFGEKDVMELLQKEGQNVNQTISRARPLEINNKILLLERLR